MVFCFIDVLFSAHTHLLRRKFRDLISPDHLVTSQGETKIAAIINLYYFIHHVDNEDDKYRKVILVSMVDNNEYFYTTHTMLQRRIHYLN